MRHRDSYDRHDGDEAEPAEGLPGQESGDDLGLVVWGSHGARVTAAVIEEVAAYSLSRLVRGRQGYFVITYAAVNRG
jgi:hypothetical protein